MTKEVKKKVVVTKKKATSKKAKAPKKSKEEKELEKKILKRKKENEKYQKLYGALEKDILGLAKKHNVELVAGISFNKENIVAHISSSTSSLVCGGLVRMLDKRVG